ncbi:MAG: TRAP transporter substrate-binding protein [Methyloligellaceae bacterium]
MKRRQFLTGLTGATVASASAVSIAKPAIASETTTLKMALAWPKNFLGLGESSQRLSEGIERATDGRYKVQLLGPGEYAVSGNLFNATSQGEIDIYHAVEYYWEEESKAFNFFATIPFGMTAYEQESWLSNMGGQKLWDQLSARYNIKPFAAGNTGVQMGGWFNRRIETLTDIRGMRLRIPGMGGDVYKRLGAKLVNIPSTQLVQALNEDRIDGTEWLGPWSDINIGLHKAAKFYHWPGFHEPGTQISLGINLDRWKGMEPRTQRIIEICARAEGQRLLAKFNAENARSIQELKALPDIQLIPYPTIVLDALGKASGESVAALSRGGQIEKQIYESFIRARWQLLQWAKFSDEAYLLARRLPFSYRRTVSAGEKRILPSKDSTPKSVSSSERITKNIPQFQVKVSPSSKKPGSGGFNPFQN